MSDSRCFLLGAEVGQDIDLVRGLVQNAGMKQTDPMVIGHLQGIRSKLERSGCLTHDEASRLFTIISRNLLSTSVLKFADVLQEPLLVPVGEKAI